MLKYFWKLDISITHIESRPSPKGSDSFRMFIDFYGSLGEPNTDKLLIELKKQCSEILILDQKQVPWFPRHISELDSIAARALSSSDLQADHPGFLDNSYRKRRDELSSLAFSCKIGDPIPKIEYTREEVETWTAILTKLEEVHNQYACKEFLDNFKSMKAVCCKPGTIPQADDISRFLLDKTGFQLRPVAGLLSSRGLRIFFFFFLEIKIILSFSHAIYI